MGAARPKQSPQNQFVEASRLHSAGNYRAALRLFDRISTGELAARAAIGSANARIMLADIAGARKDAMRALRLDPQSVEGLCLMSRVELISGRRPQALEHIDRALQQAPGLAYAVQCKAEILRLEGRKREAYDLLRERIDAGERHAGVAIAYAELASEFDTPDRSIEVVEETLKAPSTAPQIRPLLLFRLSTVLDKAKRYEQAFEYAQRANRAQGGHWSPAEIDEWYAERLEACAPETIAAMPKSSVRSDLPVFIVGMPRSGTSLIEQMLDRHPEIHGAGELEEIPRIARELLGASGEGVPIGERMQRVESHMVESRAKAHLKKLQSIAKGAARVIDKLPHNFLYLPEIAALYPKARVIHCQRDPRDTCVSCYMTGLGPAHAWSTDLISLAHYYSGYMRFMEHMHNVTDLAMLDVRYEDVIADREPQVRRILDFLGVEWHDACMAHEESSRMVMTASAEQVMQGVYTTSVARWRRYGDAFEPMIKRMRELSVLSPEGDEEAEEAP